LFLFSSEILFTFLPAKHTKIHCSSCFGDVTVKQIIVIVDLFYGSLITVMGHWLALNIVRWYV